MALSLIILIILILLSGFFSGAEVALLSLSQARVRTYLKERKKGALALYRLKSKPRRMIIIVLIGNNIVNIIAATMAAVIAKDHFGSTGLGVVAGIMTLLILIFGEITPKTFASRYAGKISLLISEPIEVLGYILYPVVILLEWVTDSMHRMVKMPKHASITEAEIKAMIEFGVEKKVVHPEEQYIINRALEFSDITAEEVMIPIKSVFSLDAYLTLSKSINDILETGFSRIPLFEKDKDNIVGIAMVKEMTRELVARREKKKLIKVSNSPIFISPDIGIDDLFKIFQEKHIHMAVVQGEDRKAIGIVTLEDLIEELVGEIIDETDYNS